jgi:hypothetical protein
MSEKSLNEKIEKVKAQREEAFNAYTNSKLVFDKCSGALEVLYNLLEEQKESKKEAKK